MSRHTVRTPLTPAGAEPAFMVRRRVAAAANCDVRAAASRFGRDSDRYHEAVERRTAAAQFTELIFKSEDVMPATISLRCHGHACSRGPFLHVGDRVRDLRTYTIVTVKNIDVATVHNAWPAYDRTGLPSVPWSCVRRGEHVCIDVEEHGGGIMGCHLAPVEPDLVVSKGSL